VVDDGDGVTVGEYPAILFHLVVFGGETREWERTSGTSCH